MVATLLPITPSAGANVTVTPSGRPEDTPRATLDFANDLERLRVMVTSFDSPGFTSSEGDDSSTVNSERGAVFSWAKRTTLISARVRVSSIFFIVAGILFRVLLTQRKRPQPAVFSQ